ncbi:hypothetical protein HMPREF1246_0213 [Acidaminococcus sp. BV3L6]|nr:hypothetical protein HMPREF1246_0213 [Acidaminococcus sp. BV3L6]
MAAFLRSFQLNEFWNRLIHDGAFIFLQQTFLDTKRQRDPQRYTYIRTRNAIR